jgi:hypothetical protein
VHETTKLYFCSLARCKYARAHGKGFPRKDNWRRHVRKHGVGAEEMVALEREAEGL